MPMTVNTNNNSLNAQRNLATNQGALATSMQRLSSGLRVNSAKDDAAGLAIAERMNAQVKGMNVAVRNANDGISMAQTAESALGKIGDNLQRMRELAVQSRNGTNSTDDQANLQKEFGQLQAEISRTIDATKFNGQSVLKTAGGFAIQVGANTNTEDTITTAGVDLSGGTGKVGTVASTDTAADVLATVFTDGSATGTTGGIFIGGTKNASGTASDAAGDTDIKNAIDAIDLALNTVNSSRADFGATQNRFEAVISNLQVGVENQNAARGRIMDADFATETSNLSRSQILQQAGTAMITQANQLPNQVLSLLR